MSGLLPDGCETVDEALLRLAAHYYHKADRIPPELREATRGYAKSIQAVLFTRGRMSLEDAGEAAKEAVRRALAQRKAER
jgi:hypothetical protein